MEKDTTDRVRKRGVKASRAKLSRALARAGLKSQNALATRIADLEDIDNPPRDLVNRVFREKPVDPLSLERIARALGVETHTLYLSSAEAPESQAGQIPPPSSHRVYPHRKRRLITPWRAGGGVIAITLLIAVGIVWNLPAATALGCGLREFLHPPRAVKGRLGIMIARFANDPHNAGQYFLATNFINDPHLDPYVSVVTTCRMLSLGGSGDIGLRRSAIRAEGRTLLEHSGARILLWGRIENNRLEVRFVSTRRGNAPVTLEIGNRPVAIEERRLRIPLVFDQSANSLPDIKKAALELMDLRTTQAARLRTRAIRSYTSSIDWLRASITASENLRNSISPRLDPRRWAIVNSDLCYNYRLLGEYDGDEAEFHAAEKACNNVLKVRPRAQYPMQWAQTGINLASVLIRLHQYADNKRDSMRLLRQSETLLTEANAVISRSLAPQTWAVVQRNLGMVYVRMGELQHGPEAERRFKRGITLTQTSLAAQNPALQPLDWAVTQQNLCLAQHELAERQGKAGIALAHDAIDHCRAALQWLSAEDSALDWAMAQNNLAISEAILAQLQGDNKSLAAAIFNFRQAQTVYTRNNLPVKWAVIEINLGELYCHLARTTGSRIDFESAVNHSDLALEVFINKKLDRYSSYARHQLAAIKACQAEHAGRCGCAGN